MKLRAIKALTGSIVAALTVSIAAAQDITNLGGGVTSTFPPGAALELPGGNVRSEEYFRYHLDGHGDFHGSFEAVRKDGKFVLGPNFNHTSCAGCHIKNGRGPVTFSKRPPGSPMLLKVSLKGLKADGSPKDVPGIGEQLQDHTVKGETRYHIKLRYKNKKGEYPDGTKYTLREPVVTFDVPAKYKNKIVTSLRLTPTVIGMGLLEAIPDETLIAMSDPDDLDGDGISGEVNYVNDFITKKKAVGRFGLRASHTTVMQQSAAAFFHDMGMTSSVLPGPKNSKEVSDDVMARLVYYLQAAGIPPARDQDDPDVIAGKALFQEIKCDSCHKMTLQTGPSDVVEVANQTIHPFTDLLLHDMGAELSDKRPEFNASGREWRTTPLWGLGLVDILSKSRPGFLHDGRARSYEEAILWHGGEAQASRERFKALQVNQRNQLLRFLRSL